MLHWVVFLGAVDYLEGGGGGVKMRRAVKREWA